MKDLYREITTRIIAALDAGTPPWLCPWTDHTGLPANLATGKPCRGINVLVLSMAQMEGHYSDARWLTFNQATALGLRIRSGAHGTPIVFWKLKECEPENADDSPRVVPLLRSYTVFNLAQLESVPDQLAAYTVPAWQPIGEAEELVRFSGAVIAHGGNRAFYSPGEDRIQLPPPTWFVQAEDYYAVALHELTHWTGHPQRLNRPLGARQGIDAYAYEELVAEMGAAFLCAHCGLPARLEHASYVDHWLDALRRDKRLIFVAAAAAQRAADYLTGTRSDDISPPMNVESPRLVA